MHKHVNIYKLILRDSKIFKNMFHSILFQSTCDIAPTFYILRRLDFIYTKPPLPRYNPTIHITDSYHD